MLGKICVILWNFVPAMKYKKAYCLHPSWFMLRCICGILVVLQPPSNHHHRKLFVGGLSAATTIEDVKHYFEQYGKVS